MKLNKLLPFILAAVLSILILLVSPFKFEKYLIEFKRSHPRQGAESIAFADMNGDGIDDFFECGYKQLGTRVSGCTCRLMDETKMMQTALEQFNVPNLILHSEQAKFSDFDRDGNTELWMLSAEKENLYLYGFEAPNLNTYKYRYPIDSAKSHRGSYAIGFHLSQTLDFNEDGMDELIFHISNSFPIYPRRNYLLNIANDTILKSPASSAGFLSQYSAALADSSLYFTGITSNPGNHKDTVDLPYPDTKGYVFALNENLEFLFPPIPVADYPNGNANYPVEGHIINVIHNSVGLQNLIVQKRVARTGKLVAEKLYPTTAARSTFSNGEVVLFLDDRIIQLDNNLNHKKEFAIDFHLSSTVTIDLNGDEKDEFILFNNSNSKCFVLNHEIDHLTPIKDEVNVSRIYTRNAGQAGTEFVSLLEDEVVYYTYFTNPLYWLKWPYIIFIVGFSYFLSSLIFKIYKRNIEQRFEQERDFNRLQILSLKNQVDPHFALNALNSIDWMYKQKEPEKASRFMEIYSRLVHQTVKNSDKISISLYEELSFCRKFCELELMRDVDFSYAINVDEDIDSFELEVPRQMVFTHVENAVKHGLRPKEGDKLLELSVDKVDIDLRIRVMNNGVPYQKKSKTSGTGKGLEIHRQLIEIYRSLKGVKIETQIGPCENGKGTCVELLMKGVLKVEDTH